MDDSRQHQIGALTALVTVQVLFGVHYFAAKIVLEQIPPAAWAFLRVVGGAITLWAVVLLLRRPLPKQWGQYAKLGVFSLFGVIFNQVFFISGLDRTTTANASILMTSIPVATLMFAVLLRREMLSPRKGWSLLISIAGVLLVLGVHRFELSSETLAGDVMIVINALSFSFFLVISRRLLQQVDSLAATAVLMLFGTVGIGLYGAAPALQVDYSGLPPTTWVWALFIVVGPTALAYLLNFYALRHVESSTVALFIYLQPVVAVLLGVTLLAERPAPRVWLGGALVFLGVYISQRRNGR